uniref:Reverse transcriptase domain-containing protein n=1 Tax=Cacopsylla melanoneura TaxID=428564 RepID=A0A8D9FAZ2_9HEMI
MTYFTQESGPKLYNDLINILLSYRLFPYVISTDIKRMYLRILLKENQRKYQKVLCRFSPQEELKTYTLNTVTFGLSCSPYLALRCVKELATTESKKYPLASERVLSDSYMDDICSSVSSESVAIELQAQLVAMFKTGGFELSKWASNSSALLSRIPDEDKLESCLSWDDSSFKVLGLSWHPVTDTFAYEVNVKSTECTKRNVLKLTASIFDVLGLLAPVTLYANLLIKHLWQQNIGWDEKPPEHIQNVWRVFQQELTLLSSLSFRRHIDVFSDSHVTLVGFGDASEKAYACVIYSVVKSPQGEVMTNLVCAKSKVSPLKTLSIPRLELCAARLLSKLIKQVADTYSPRVKINKIVCLSDSKVVLDWVRSPYYRWNQFVSNRVAKIQENVGSDSFHHIAGKENVSDCVSRGMLPR